MTSYELIKRIPKLSDAEAKQISNIILSHKSIIIDHAKKILENFYNYTKSSKGNIVSVEEKFKIYYNKTKRGKKRRFFFSLYN